MDALAVLVPRVVDLTRRRSVLVGRDGPALWLNGEARVVAMSQHDDGIGDADRRLRANV